MGEAMTRSRAPSLPVITCAICGRPVERTEVWDDPADHSLTVKVWCHGQQDETRLGHDFLARLNGGEREQLRTGVAFAHKRLEERAHG